MTVTVTSGTAPPIARPRPETQAVVRESTADFDALYAAHYADLTVQLYAYFGDRHEAQDLGCNRHRSPAA